MCGIVGYIGTQPATDILLNGLEKLEYRGYDSAGLATVWQGELNCVRAKGKLYNLRDKIPGEINPAQIGIAHTRWATHGKPEEYNAHPQMDARGKVAVVQNGIIENYRKLKEELTSQGYEFLSETDTEVIPHLLASYADFDFLTAVAKTVGRLEGAFALAILNADYHDELIIVRHQAPIVIGFGQGEFFCASDITAIAPYTQTILSLENGEIARLTPLGVEIYDFQLNRVKKAPRTLNWSPVTVEKQGFKHFMLKEIHEQPTVMRACLHHYLQVENSDNPIQLGLSPQTYENLQYIQIVACGTSWHASLIGKYLLEQLAGIPTSVQYASEFRYSPSPLMPHTLTIGVTQSGETADTIAAIAMEKQRRTGLEKAYQAHTLGITNRPESSLGEMVDQIINIHAGIEIGVAATKSFTAQLLGFYVLALDLAYRRQTLSTPEVLTLINKLQALPDQVATIIAQQESKIEQIAHEFQETQDFIFIGRGINFPIALEGALKLKEISYIHAEGYPAGEMKHGPIALLDAKVPVVAIAMPGTVYEKVLSNAQEAKARDARLIGITSVDAQSAESTFNDLIAVPSVSELFSPVLSVIPLQLLAYYIAAIHGLDVDQPRNLAKSVTVE